MICALLVIACTCALLATPAQAQSGARDFLSPAEADKIRDAQTPDARVRLFVTFAEDRLKKLQYELSSKEATQNRDMLLNGLLNGYASCLDEATDRLQDAKAKGADIRQAIKDMQKQTKLFLDELHKIQDAGGPELETFKDSLSDAINSTQDALNESNKASKEYGAVPIRRKP
ncbi:MAG TPA: hypothetical protein VJN21_14845 [Candidatus Acidoferrales bacterium]|nr:hypothetical protein [Candidatus Acidoferrales bacterium]